MNPPPAAGVKARGPHSLTGGSPIRPAPAALTPALVLVLLALPGSVPADAPADAWWTRTGLDADADGVDDRLRAGSGVVRVLVDYAHAPGARELDALEARGARVVTVIDVVPVVIADVPADRVRDVADAPGVVLVEADARITPLLDKSRGAVRADAASDTKGLTGKGVTVAVLDTGVRAHPDLDARLVARHDATLPPLIPRTLLGIPVPAEKPVTDPHGTHVAGIVLGTGSESRGTYRGIAPGAGLVDVRVFDEEGSSSTSVVLNGVDWVVANRERFGIRVMQMSLGGNGTDGSDALSRAVNVAADRGLLTVAAAGNKGPDARTITVPGVAARALTVGAVDDRARAADFSSRGPTVDERAKPDVVAPGVAIRSTNARLTPADAAYRDESGTSMAAPHVAGAAALVWEANASLTAAEVKWILTATSARAGPSPGAWHATFGWGLLDARAAIAAAEDPRVLGEAPFAAKAAQIPVDGSSAPLDQLSYEAGRAQRVVPAPAIVTALVVALALAGVHARGRAR